MTETTNYKLKKPGASDNAQVDVLNGNMDVIDRELKLRATLGRMGRCRRGSCRRWTSPRRWRGRN